MRVSLPFLDGTSDHFVKDHNSKLSLDTTSLVKVLRLGPSSRWYESNTLTNIRHGPVNPSKVAIGAILTHPADARPVSNYRIGEIAVFKDTSESFQLDTRWNHTRGL